MTPKNDKLMNERERGLLRLLANAMNDLGKLRDSIAASRDAQGDDVLPCPLRVGAGTFGKGIKISTVQGAIDRAISYRDDEISKLRAAQGEDEGWRTMRDAPTDGRAILAYWKRRNVCGVVSFYDGEWRDEDRTQYNGPDLWRRLPPLPAPPVIGEKDGV